MSVRKTLRQYRALETDLQGRLEELELKGEALRSSLPDETVVTELELEDSDDGSARHVRLLEKKKVRLKATEVLLSILQLKMSFITDVVQKLESLNRENPQQLTPLQLQLARFYDWVETNQQLYELNTQLYEIEKSKLNMEKPRRQHAALATPVDHSIFGTTSVTPSITQHMNKSLSGFDTAVTTKVNLYVAERLHPRNHRMTFEATKIEEYVNECNLHQGGSLESPPQDTHGVIRGAHPQSYHAFTEVLCNYIVERHRSSQGEDLSYETIYTAIEHNLMPRIKHCVLKYISKAEEDRILHEQCLRFADITLSQLRVPLSLRSKELVPFADAIAHMRATYFSQSPTDKMYSVVAAAKALHEQLSSMEEGSIDGDTFLDFWVYVTIKANVRDMATNVMFMSEYGNPQLSIAEAGYYLTTLYAAISYIKELTPEKLTMQEENNSQFIMCDIDEARLLTSQQGTCMRFIQQAELVGYVPAVVRKWLMDTSRLYSTVLVDTGDTNDKLQVAVVQLSNSNSSSQHVEYFYEALTSHEIPGVSCRSLSNGFALLADPQQCGDELILLQTGNTSEQLSNLRYAMQLIRLGSERAEDDDEDPSTHRSLPHSTSASPFSIIPSPRELQLENIEAELDSNDRKELTRNRFTLPTRSDLKKLVQRKEASSRLAQNGAVSDYTPLPESIVVSAEVHTAPSVVELAMDDDDFERNGGKKCSIRSRSIGSMDTDHSVSLSESTNYEPPPAVDLLSSDYVTYLESNYVKNHLYGNQRHSVKNSVVKITMQCQMMLQRLNFLSFVRKLDGVYDDATMNAVQTFQVLHNEQDNFSSVQLPENGILTIATMQYLRQELLTIFANLMRLRKDVGLDALSTFDPLSIDREDIVLFHDLITKFQRKFQVPQTGVLCAKTVNHIKKLLHSQRTTSVRSERGNTL